MKQNICLLFAILFFVCSKAQTVIPFHLTEHNNIIVKTLVNEKDSLNLMFQIAMEDASISPNRINRAENILFDKNGISEDNKLQIGNLIWKNIRFFDGELSGQQSDGKIGTSIFKDQIFKIDYDNNLFVIYDEMPDLKNYTSIPLTYKNKAIFIDIDNIINNKSYIHSFYLQSGYSGGLLYDNQFSDTNLLPGKLKIIEKKILKNSYGQEIIIKQGVLPQMKIGNLQMENVLAGFFTGDIKNQKYSLFGADLLKRFNWIFDVDRKIAYIQPSKLFNSDY